MNTTLLRRQLTYRLRHLGWQGLSGLTLLIVAFAYAAVVFPSSSQRTVRFNNLIVEANTKLKQLEEEPASSKPTTPAERLQVFYQEFPKGTTVPDWLEKIYAIAEEQKLALDVGEYALTRAQSGRLDKFKITLPVKGTYPQIRRFIAAALSTAPALSLDGLYLKRDKVADGTVDARIIFLLHLEKGA